MPTSRKLSQSESSSAILLPALTGKSISAVAEKATRLPDPSYASVSAYASANLPKNVAHLPSPNVKDISSSGTWINPPFIPKVKERRKSIQMQMERSADSSSSDSAFPLSSSRSNSFANENSATTSLASNTSLNNNNMGNKQTSYLKKDSSDNHDPAPVRSRRTSNPNPKIGRELNGNVSQAKLPEALKDASIAKPQDQRNRRRSSSVNEKDTKGTDSFSERPLSSLIESETSEDSKELKKILPDSPAPEAGTRPRKMSMLGNSAIQSSSTDQATFSANEPCPRRLSILSNQVQTTESPAPVRPRRLSMKPSNITESVLSATVERSTSPSPVQPRERRASLHPFSNTESSSQETSPSPRERRASILSDHKKLIQEALSMTKSASNIALSQTTTTDAPLLPNNDSNVMVNDDEVGETAGLGVQFAVNFKPVKSTKPVVRKLEVRGLALLAANPHFRDHKDVLDKMDILLTFSSVTKGSVIITQTQPQPLLTFILEGECSVFKEYQSLSTKFTLQLPNLSTSSFFPALERLGSNSTYLEYEPASNLQKQVYLDHYAQPRVCEYTVVAKSDVQLVHIPMHDFMAFANVRMLYGMVMSPCVVLEKDEAVLAAYEERQKWKTHQRKNSVQYT